MTDIHITKRLYCIYIVYKTLYIVFIHFFCKDMPTEFSAAGGLICPNNIKNPFMHDHLTKI